MNPLGGGLVLSAVIAGSVVIGSAVVGAVRSAFSAEARNRRRLKKPAERIHDVANGTWTKITGTAHDPHGDEAHPLIAPLSGVPCIGWSISVLAKSAALSEVGRSARATTFVVDDGTGRAFVDPTFCQIDASGRMQRSFTTISPEAVEALCDVLSKAGITLQCNLHDDQFTVSEGLLRAGEPVAVIGRGSWEPERDPSTAAGYRDPIAQRLRLCGTATEPMMISDAERAAM